ncbi:MAG: histidine phosphatase family protein [Dongiaceae bacterium]
MALLALLRHGPTEWNTEHRLQGRTDLPLSAAGRAAVKRWEPPHWSTTCGWITSPLSRCIETAEILRRRSGALAPLRIEPALAEMSFGAWEGRRLADLRRELGRGLAELEARGLDFRAPGGESPRDVQARLRPWLGQVGNLGGTTLAIAHKGVIRAIYAMATSWTMAAKPPDKLQMDCLQLFDVSPDGQVRISQLNLPIASAAAADAGAS